ncbi:MAG: response regulator [Pseudomonadota bacterium]|nr:response regulator [Pseudomonadota bacterium]
MRHAQIDPETASERPRQSANLVYVVDDEAHLRDSSCFLLATLGLDCVQFEGGADFLGQLATLDPGVILLDMRMRGMSGLEVQAELTRRGVGWPVVFMSGHQDVPVIVEAIKSGAVEFLEKPFSDEQLLAALHRGFRMLKDQPGGVVR